MSKKAVVALAEGFEEIEAATPIDVLRRAGVEVVVAGLAAGPIRGAHGLCYSPDEPLVGLAGDFDAVIFPGGMPGAKNLGESAAAKKLAESMFAAGKIVAAICAAPVFTLGAWGLLDGRTATCYPGMESMLPEKTRFAADRVVVDGRITTSRGPGTAMDFSLAIARQLVGDAKTDEVASALLLG